VLSGADELGDPAERGRVLDVQRQTLRGGGLLDHLPGHLGERVRGSPSMAGELLVVDDQLEPVGRLQLPAPDREVDAVTDELSG
jgi:hypothetical protein